MTAKVTAVERFILHVPFVERVRRDMERAGVHSWSELEITRVETDSAGIVGWGETIQNYTWGRVKDEERVIGKAPAETMWDDSLGAGLQMALFDAAGKLAGVPVYRLLGPKCRDWCAISFWDHDIVRKLRCDLLFEHFAEDTSSLDDRQAFARYREVALKNRKRRETGESMQGQIFAMDPANWARRE